MQCAPRRARARNRVPRLLFPLAWDNSKLSKREQIYFFFVNANNNNHGIITAKNHKVPDAQNHVGRMEEIRKHAFSHPK